MRVGICTMEKIENRPVNSVGSSRIRGRWLARYWDEAEEYKVGKPYDALIFQKAYWREMIMEFKGIKIFDICDPDWLEPRPVIESIMNCDAAVTSTEALAEYLRQFITDRPIICIPDRVDLAEHRPRAEHQGLAKKVVWFGYAQNSHYLVNTFPFLVERDLELTVISNQPIYPPTGFERMKINNVDYSYQTVHEELKRHDLVLLPQTDTVDLKGQYKSNNKTLTAWALGLPVVTVPEDLDRFASAESRNEERASKLAEIEQKWDIKISVAEYQNLISTIQAKRGA